MGSPLGPSFANMFMCALEKNFLSNCPLHFKPLLYGRCVDDTFCIFQNSAQAESFLQYLNQQHPNISFTHEVEKNKSLPFLDVLITHTNKQTIRSGEKLTKMRNFFFMDDNCNKLYLMFNMLIFLLR